MVRHPFLEKLEQLALKDVIKSLKSKRDYHDPREIEGLVELELEYLADYLYHKYKDERYAV